jgi:hypothetical protein
MLRSVGRELQESEPPLSLTPSVTSYLASLLTFLSTTSVENIFNCKHQKPNLYWLRQIEGHFAHLVSFGSRQNSEFWGCWQVPRAGIFYFFFTPPASVDMSLLLARRLQSQVSFLFFIDRRWVKCHTSWLCPHQGRKPFLQVLPICVSGATPGSCGPP